MNISPLRPKSYPCQANKKGSQVKKLALVLCLLCFGMLAAVTTANAAVATNAICIPEAANTAIKSTGSEGKCAAKTVKRFVVNEEDNVFFEHLTLEEESNNRINVELEDTSLKLRGTLAAGGTANFFTEGEEENQGNVFIISSKECAEKHVACGDLSVGEKNKIKGAGSVAFGLENEVNANYAAILGGKGKKVSAEFESIF
jgi:hypothetical protein